MTSESASGPADDDDMLAAEYVVGTLSADERKAVTERLARDPAFARLVEAWEARLSPLSAGYAPVTPPGTAKPAIDRILFSAATPAHAATGDGLWRSLAFWRGFGAVAVVLLAIAVASPWLMVTTPPAGSQFVAAIAPKAGDVSYLAYYDAATGNLSLVHLSGQRGAEHDFELWAIEGTAKPVSLGVIRQGGTVRVAVRPAIGKDLAHGGVLAISLEPAGGSPTGQPTGPVVALGGMHRL
jgi:anti-sigma-K factor RskA